MRSYFRVDPQMVEKKLAAGYAPAQVGAFVMLLSQAEQQPQRGRFRSLGELRAAMDCKVEEAGKGAGMSKFVPFLLEQGDVVRLDDGRYYVDGWDEWQEGDWQVAERMRRVRERKNPGTKHADTARQSASRNNETGDSEVTNPQLAGQQVPTSMHADPLSTTGWTADRTAANDAAKARSELNQDPNVTATVTPDVTVPVTVGVTPDVTARDARRSAAAAAPCVAAAASDVAVSRQQQAASETAPLPLPLPPEVIRRVEELDDGCLEILAGRLLKPPERDLIRGWASTLRRRGELVPVPEILDTVRREMTRPTPEGGLPVNLAWCADAVAALARERAGPAQSLPRSVQEAIDYDQAWAKHAERLRQEGL